MKYKIALVEYLNTRPFSEGMRLHHLTDVFDIFRVPPSVCAEMFSAGQADISLCPVGALHEMPDYEMSSQYCIGADGEVGTVMLLSRVPLEDIRTVRLDEHSRTSNLLVQILCERYWGMSWEFVTDTSGSDDQAHLMIGDKVFTNVSSFPFRYDLAQAWKALTGLPMVFAVWINRPGIPESVMSGLDKAFKDGIDNIATSTDLLKDWQRDYLLHNISYSLDGPKRKALELFLQWAEACSVDPVTR